MSELRNGAILFADIAAATALRARVGDREADALLDPVLAALTRIIGQHGGRVIKSDGDDVLAVFERPGRYLEDAVNAAIEGQQDARRRKFSLYAGLHAGEIEFRDVLGRPDVSGMAVNMAARLHKLVPDLPGHIFLAAEMVKALPGDLQDRVRPYGSRPIKGVGVLDIVTLDWDEQVTVMPTRFADPSLLAPRPATGLTLRHGERQLVLAGGQAPVLLGRDRHCELRIDDPEQRVSSRHLKVHNRSGAWHVQDTSRNGSWVRFDGTRNEIALLGEDLKLISSGTLSLGRRFADDPEGRYAVRFEMERRG